jgi:hypothetical protein
MVVAADAWAMSARLMPPARRLVVAALLVVPSAVFVTANVLQHELGIDGAAEWIDPLFAVRGVGWLLTFVIVAGPVAALSLAATRLLPIRFVRDDDAWELRIRVRPDRWAVTVAVISLLVGGILAAHLVAENLPCVMGLRSVC